MRLFTAFVLLSLLASKAVGQVFPVPDESNPRIQSVQWLSGEAIVLTTLPGATLTVILEPSERVTRATLSGSRLWDISVPSERNSLQITPEAGALAATLSVATDQREYEFLLETGQGLMAAYLVQITFGPTAIGEPDEAKDAIDNLTWGYRVRGDREVRPQSIRDNGEKTVITYAPGQSLPAVFAVGPTGDEEVVDGYMRGSLFVIDRVHSELVFRIDRDRATAKRNRREDEVE